MVYLSVFIGYICSQVYVVARIKLKTSKIIISCEVNAGEQVYTMFWLTLWRTLPSSLTHLMSDVTLFP